MAPEIIPGLPPKRAVIIPTIKAAYNPNKGGTPATNANATASGTNAIATVNPASISILKKEIEYELSLRFELFRLKFLANDEKLDFSNKISSIILVYSKFIYR